MPDRMNRDRTIINGLPSDLHVAPARRLGIKATPANPNPKRRHTP